MPSELLCQIVELEREHGAEADGMLATIDLLRDRLAVLSVDEVFALVCNTRELEEDKAYWVCIRTLQYRADPATFEQCKLWAYDALAERRQAAADVLSQLSQSGERPFTDASLPLLELLLNDSDKDVLASALYACGHLQIGNPGTLAKFVAHAEPHVRRGAVQALSMRVDPISTGGLIVLSRDDDYDIRNWATLALGQMTDADNPEIREALYH
jgi:HEAT repeat protein